MSEHKETFGPFDTADTGGAGHPLDGERDRLGGDFR